MNLASISSLEIVLGLISFIASTYLGLAVYLKNPKSWTNRFFLMLAIAIDAYIMVNPISLHPPAGTQLFWIRAVMFSVSFMPPILFLLVHTFPGKDIRLPKKYVSAVVFVMLAAAAISLSPLVFSELQYLGGEPVPVPGTGMPFFALNFVGFLLLSFVLLFYKHKRAIGQDKARTLYLLIGVLATFTLMTIFTLVFVVILQTSATIFLGPIFPVIMMGAIGYSIVKHRFLDIQPIIARAVSFVIFLLILAIAYGLIFIGLLRRLLGVEINSLVSLIFLGLTVAAMLSFQPLQNRIRRWSSKYFLRGEYNRDELLSALTHIMAENIELKKLAADTLGSVGKAMKIGKFAFLIIDGHTIKSVEGVGYDKGIKNYAPLEKLLHSQESSRRHFILDDLEEGALKATFRELEVVFAAPIRVEKNEVAVLILGPKLSGEAYYETDVEVLDIFSAEAGIAIQNAKSYEEIKQFNVELEGKVEERTKELKESQERELAKAMTVAKLKDEFVFLAAHELRTPVTVIRGFLEMVNDSGAKFSKDVKSNLDSIFQASEHLNQLLNNLLEIARSEAGTTKIVTAPLDIALAVESTAKELSSVARKKNIKISVTSESGLPPVLADAAKLNEVLMNLVGNAVKYNREGGSVDVAVRATGKQAEITIKDTGFGIPKDQQARIFEKFFRAQSRDTQEITGTGLGLFITKMLIEKMNGVITFSSEEGKGSIFTFLLPIA